MANPTIITSPTFANLAPGSTVPYADQDYIVDTNAFADLRDATDVSDADTNNSIEVLAGSYGSTSARINNKAGVTFSVLNTPYGELDTTSIQASTFTNNGIFNLAKSTITVSTFVNAGIVTLKDGASFTATNDVTNTNTFNITGGATVNASFSGNGTVNIFGTLDSNTNITNAENSSNTFVFNGTTTLTGSTISAKAMTVNANVYVNGATVSSTNATINAYIYVQGTSTLDLNADANSTKTISFDNGAELKSSTIKNVALKVRSSNTDAVTVFGENSEIDTILLQGKDLNIGKAKVDNVAPVTVLKSKQITTGGGHLTIQNATVQNQDNADLSIVSTGEIDISNSTVSAAITATTGTIEIADSNVSGSLKVSQTAASNTLSGDNTLDVALTGKMAFVDGASLTDSTVTGGELRNESGTITYNGSNEIERTVVKSTLVLDKSADKEAFLKGDVAGANGTIQIKADAVTLSKDVAGEQAAQVIQGSVAPTRITNNVSSYYYIDSTAAAKGLYVTLEDDKTLFINATYVAADNSAITTDGHIVGYNAFKDLNAFTYHEHSKNQTAILPHAENIVFADGNYALSATNNYLFSDKGIAFAGTGTGTGEVNLGGGRFILGKALTVSTMDDYTDAYINGVTAPTFMINENLTVTVGQVRIGNTLNYGTTKSNEDLSRPESDFDAEGNATRTAAKGNLVINGKVNATLYAAPYSTITVNPSGSVYHDGDDNLASSNFYPNSSMTVTGDKDALADEYQVTMKNIGFLDGGSITLNSTRAQISKIRFERLNGDEATPYQYKKVVGLLDNENPVVTLNNTYLETVDTYSNTLGAGFFREGFGGFYESTDKLTLNLKNGSEMVVHTDFNPYSWTEVNVGLATGDSGSNKLTADSITNAGTINVYSGSTISTGATDNKKNITTTATGSINLYGAAGEDKEATLKAYWTYVTGGSFYANYADITSRIQNKASVTIANSTISSNNITNARGTFTVTDSTVNATKLTVSDGTFSVGGISKLTIGTLTGVLTLANGAKFSDSSITDGSAGSLLIDAGSEVTFYGATPLTATAITNKGNLVVDTKAAVGTEGQDGYQASVPGFLTADVINNIENGTITVNAGSSISATSINGGTIKLVGTPVDGDLVVTAADGLASAFEWKYGEGDTDKVYFAADEKDVSKQHGQYWFTKTANKISVSQINTNDSTLIVNKAYKGKSGPVTFHDKTYMIDYNAFWTLADITFEGAKDGTFVDTVGVKPVTANSITFAVGEAAAYTEPAFLFGNNANGITFYGENGFEATEVTISQAGNAGDAPLYLMGAVEVENEGGYWAAMQAASGTDYAGAQKFTIALGLDLTVADLRVGLPLNNDDFDTTKAPKRQAAVGNLTINGIVRTATWLVAGPLSKISVDATGKVFSENRTVINAGSTLDVLGSAAVKAAEGYQFTGGDLQFINGSSTATFKNSKVKLAKTDGVFMLDGWTKNVEYAIVNAKPVEVTFDGTILDITGSNKFFNYNVTADVDNKITNLPALNLTFKNGSVATATGADLNVGAKVDSGTKTDVTVNVLSNSSLSVKSVSNYGTINVGNAAEGDIAASKGTLTATSITNNGTINAYNGSTVTLTAGTLTNTGTITAYSDSSLTLGGGSTNDGTIELYGTADKKSTITLTGAFTNDGTYTAGVNVGKINLTNGEIVGQGWIYNRYQGVMTLINSDLNVETSVLGGELNAENSNFTPKSGDKNLNAQNGSITLVATGTGSSSITANNLRVNNADSAIRINDADDVITNGAAINKTVTEGKYATQVNVNAITNAGTIKAAYADITAETVANSGTFELANATVTASSVSVTGENAKFNVSGDATLNFALSGQVTVKDNAVFTKSDITDTASTVDAAGKLFIAANKTATFKDVDTVGNTVSVDIVNDGGIINVGIAAAAGTLNAGNISFGTIEIAQASKLISTGTIDQATITVDGQLTAAKFTASTITIKAAGAVEETDPIALTVTGNDGIASSVIDLTVSAETLAGSTASYQFVQGTVALTGDNAVTLKVNGTTYVENQVIGESNYILTTKGGTGLWMVKKAPTTTLSVSSAYTPATDGWNISKFASLVLALKDVQPDTASLVVEEGYAPTTPETLTDDLTVTFIADDAAISGKAFTLAGDEDENKENLILRAADGKTLTIGNNITLNNANIVLNNGKQSTAIVSGNLKGNEVQIDGNATVTGTLTADTLLWLRNGKSVATPGAEGNAITLSKAVSAETVLISSGKVAMTTADADVFGTSLIVGPVDDTTAAVSIVSDGADWTFTSNMLATGTNADSFTLNGGSLSFAGTAASSIKITNPVVHNSTVNPVPAGTALIENANFTLTLNSGAKLNAKTIDNIGKIIMVDGSATEINATAIVNRASAEVPIPAQKAIINAKNITAGSIENYGTIGNLEVENQKIAKLDVGTLTNNQYGDVFATALEADSIENSGEIVVTTLTITSADGLIDNKAGGKIAQDNVAMTIDAKAIDNAGYISTHGGAITATKAVTNDGSIITASLTADGNITNSGTITASSVTATADNTELSNTGTIEAATLTARRIVNDAGSVTVTESLEATQNVIAKGGEIKLSGSIKAAALNAQQNGTINITDATTVDVGNIYVYNKMTATSSNLSNQKFSVEGGDLTVTKSNITGITLTGTMKLDDTDVANANVAGTFKIISKSTFSGINQVGGLTVDEGATLTIDASKSVTGVGPSLYVVGAGSFGNAGAITIDAKGLLWGSAWTPIQVVKATGITWSAASITVTTDDPENQAIALIQEDGIYLYKHDSDINLKTIVVNSAWANRARGTTETFGGVEYVIGFNAFATATNVNFTADTEEIKFASGTDSYGNLVLSSSTNITVWNATGEEEGGTLKLDSFTVNGLGKDKTRINIGEVDDNQDPDTIVNIAGNVEITDADVDFDEAATTIGGSVTIGGELGSEVEFDRATTISGTLTLEAGSQVEANQGYVFSLGNDGSAIDGTLYVNTDEDITTGTDANLRNITGTGKIYTDVNSDLKFGGTFTGNLYIDVTGLEFGEKKFQTTSSSTYKIFISGENVEADPEGYKLWKKYFTYSTTTGLTQRDDACNVYKVEGEGQLNTATAYTWNWTDGQNVNHTAHTDNIVVTGGDFAGTDSATSFKGIAASINDGTFSASRTLGGTTLSTGTAWNYAQTTGTYKLTVNDGTFNSLLVGCDRVTAGSGVHIAGDDNVAINMTINGGEFKKNVAAGMLYDQKVTNGTAAVDGDIYLTITGGTFFRTEASPMTVYGGNVASNSGYSANTVVYGDITVTIDAQDTTISLQHLIVGSYGKGRVTGDTTLILSGDGSKLSADRFWGGSGSDVYEVTETTKTAVSTVDGDRILSFEGFTGKLNVGSIKMFDIVKFDKDSDVNFENFKGTLAEIENWEIAYGSENTGAFNNSFIGDTLALTGLADMAVDEKTGIGTWTIFDDVSKFAADEGNKLAFASVSFDDNLASYDLSIQSINDKDAMVLTKQLA